MCERDTVAAGSASSLQRRDRCGCVSVTRLPGRLRLLQSVCLVPPPFMKKRTPFGASRLYGFYGLR